MAFAETRLEGEDFQWSERVPEEQYGLIDRTRLDEFQVHPDFEILFDALQEQPPSEVALNGKLHVLVLHDQVTSVLIRNKLTGVQGSSLNMFRMRAISLVRCSDGVLRGESHTARGIIRRDHAQSQLVEDKDSVMPLTDEDIETFIKVCTTLRERRPR